jgi:hypothetical protein
VDFDDSKWGLNLLVHDNNNPISIFSGWIALRANSSGDRADRAGNHLLRAGVDNRVAWRSSDGCEAGRDTLRPDRALLRGNVSSRNNWSLILW